MKPPASSQPRRAVAAAFIGTMIEWYDFYIYATAAALLCVLSLARRHASAERVELARSLS
ncbi:hypothetical protein J2X87_003771 [Pseudomonas synxantha]|uniref:Uncharacterized protein n=1 Tax=Pseudomonas synxantha TaxID=47883 RepID=A0ACC6JR56_9PSED|nr:hypothetical protein [Pseudomonas synxantha]MDR6608684.1 hypothetical protein [Pseudomonas synxantha]